MENIYKTEINSELNSEETIKEFLISIEAEIKSEDSFELGGELWFIDKHPFDHSDDIIIEENIAPNYDKFLLVKTGSDRTRIVGWTDKKTLMSVPARDIYRNGKKFFVVIDTNVNDLSYFKIKKDNLKLKTEFIINQQEAENYGHTEMISGILSGLHYFCKKANVYFKDINQKDEAILGDKKIKIFTRDYMSDEDMLIPEEYFLKHPEIDYYVLCKIKGGKYSYLGFVKKSVVSETRVVQMTGNVDMGSVSERIKRIFAEQYLNLNELIKIYEEEKEEEAEIIPQNYVPLHVHSEWSVGDGFGKTDYLAETARLKGFKALALTDHGTMAGVWEFQKNCLLKNIKPILGEEFYVSYKDEEKRFHIILLVKNKEGWKNILKLQALATREGFYYKPIVKFEQILEHHEGLILSTACNSGLPTRLIEENKLDEAEQVVIKLKEVFKDDFYIEIQPYDHGNSQEVYEKLSLFAEAYKVKCIVTNDVHYPKKEDKKYQEAIKSINFKKPYGTAGFSDDCFYLMTDDDLKNKVSGTWMENKLEEYKKNTFEVADKCNFTIEPVPELDTLPKFQFPEEYDKEALERFNEYLKSYKGEDLEEKEKENFLDKRSKFFISLAYKGLQNRGKNNKEYVERLNLELLRIIKKGYVNYFLIMWDLAMFCEKAGIMKGAGRGSVGASLVSYSLKITEVDPIKYNLLFDRFISSIRKDFVDIDIDYQDTRRQEVFQYLIDKYGRNHCCKVATYARFHPKGVLRDLGRIFGVPSWEINKVCALVLERSGGDARASFGLTDTFEEFAEAKAFKNKYPQLSEIAMKLEGHIRHKSSHAAAMILTEHDSCYYAPINKIGSEYCIEWEKQYCEDMHLIKYDILGLKTLSIIKDAVESSGAVLPTDFEDKKVYETVFKDAKTIGVFQLGTVGMQKFSEQLKINCFTDLYDATTLFRPSCLHSGQAQIYANRKTGKEPIEYFHPSLKEITQESKGVILYQEQIMQIMNSVAGLSWATAEMARKVITKSKGKDAFNKMRQDFVNGAKKKSNIDREEAEKLFDIVSTFGCLTGDTKIYRASSNQYKKREITLKEAFEYQNSDNFKHRGLRILAMSADGNIRPHKVKKIVKTGIKPVFYIRTSSGKTIKASKKHRFLIRTKKGDEWLTVNQISSGDYIRVTDLKLPKKIYGYGIGKGSHKDCPRFRKGKGSTNEEIKRKSDLMKIFKGRCQVCSSKRLIELHHINKNHLDNSEENTMLLCRKCHRKFEDADFSRFQKGYYSFYDKIEEVKYSSDRETYDIEMDEPPRNFIANRFVSHNSYGFNKCISKDSTILIPKGKGMKRISIEQAYREKPNQVYSYDPNIKKSYRAKIKEIVKTGKKRVFEVICKTNRWRKIKVTKDHKFLTKEGWKRLRDLSVGDEVLVKAPSTILFGKENPWEFAKIEYIIEQGLEETYDIHVDDKNHNYIANMFVVHNSHAVEYSILSYWEAWLKTYYPQHFFKALLKYETDESEMKNYIQDAKNYGVEFEFPDINKSAFQYDIHEKKIYAGLNSINGLGAKNYEKILAGRPYTSYEDFKKRCKVSKKILKGLIVSDAFREFGVNKKRIYEPIKNKNCQEDFNEVEQAQLIFSYTSLTPKLDILKSYDFGNFDFINIKDLGLETASEQVFVRGIVTDVLKKDKLLRKSKREHVHKFEQHLYYLNLNDGTGNIACQVAPETYEKYQEQIQFVKKQPVIIYGKTDSGGRKIFVDMLEIIQGEHETHEMRQVFYDDKMAKEHESFIISAHPFVSKNNKSYYKVILADGTQGLCFRFSKKIFPGQKVSYWSNKEPFINLKFL